MRDKNIPVISVIVPVFNAEKYLNRCVNSILEQTFSDFELILIDDGSRDKSSEICDDYAEKDERVRVIHQSNRGQAAARNYGVSKAKGEWIAFVDADDMIHHQMLEFLYFAVQKHETKISCCGAYEDKIVPIKFFKNYKYKSCAYDVDEQNLVKWYLGEDSVDKYLYWVVWGKLIHRSILEELPLEEGRIYEDNAIVFRWLFEAKRVAFCNSDMYFYFFNKVGTTKNTYSLKHLDLLWALKKQYVFYNSINFNFIASVVGKRYLFYGLGECQKVDNLLREKKIAARLRRSLLLFWIVNRKWLKLSKNEEMDVLTRLYPKQIHFLWLIKHITIRRH